LIEGEGREIVMPFLTSTASCHGNLFFGKEQEPKKGKPLSPGELCKKLQKNYKNSVLIGQVYIDSDDNYFLYLGRIATADPYHVPSLYLYCEFNMERG
jgi:hypothetical protein